MTRTNSAPDLDATQGHSNVVSFPWREPEELRLLRQANMGARTIEELRALAVLWHHAVRAFAGPNAVWVNDSLDDDEGAGANAPGSNRVPFHKATRIYPMMSGDRFKEVKADIKANSLIKKIVRCKNDDGQWAILDGRARYDICLELGIEPKFVDSDIPNPETYLMSVNLMRRDLSDLQRNLIAARTVTAKVGGDRLSGYEQTVSISATCADGGKPKEERTIEEAAAIYRRKSSGVERARTILDRGTPQFIACIERADYSWVSTKKAIDIVTLTTTEKLDDLTSEEKQRQWLKDNNLFKRAKKPPLGPLESFRRKWGYLSPEDRRKFAANDALPWLIEQARLDGVTEIAIGDAKIIIDP